ncbi:hypothetical protein K438DRAFT_1942131 [Mycena galopus ATCC 62051]|nr:hypothetical protein K438DRAFT_1942131 [Mycena galopus ATCC 62051]
MILPRGFEAPHRVYVINIQKIAPARLAYPTRSSTATHSSPQISCSQDEYIYPITPYEAVLKSITSNGCVFKDDALEVFVREKVAQARISAGPLGPCITWIQAEPLAFLSADPDAPHYDVAVLAHRLWYFSSPRRSSQRSGLLPRVRTASASRSGVSRARAIQDRSSPLPQVALRTSVHLGPRHVKDVMSCTRHQRRICSFPDVNGTAHWQCGQSADHSFGSPSLIRGWLPVAQHFPACKPLCHFSPSAAKYIQDCNLHSRICLFLKPPDYAERDVYPGIQIRFAVTRELAQKPHEPHTAFWHCAKPYEKFGFSM